MGWERDHPSTNGSVAFGDRAKRLREQTYQRRGKSGSKPLSTQRANQSVARTAFGREATAQGGPETEEILR